MFEELWLVPLGFAAGTLGSIVGLGGGILVVPVLTFLGFPPVLAASNSLFATFGNAAASTVSYSRQKRIDYTVGLRLGLLSVPGTVLGAYLSTDATPHVFQILFGIVLSASAIYILARRKLGPRESNIPGLAVLVTGASFFAGMISSFFGIGGGIVFVPLMVIAMGMGMKHAAPTSQFILLFASLAGMISHSMLGHPDFYQSALLAMGAFFGGLLGARLSAGMRESRLRILVSAVMIAAAVKMFIDTTFL